MILRAPVGTIDEVMLWLKGLQAGGCVTVRDAVVTEADEAAVKAFGRPEGGGALIDPRKVNVFLGEIRDCKTQDARSEKADAGEGLGV